MMDRQISHGATLIMVSCCRDGRIVVTCPDGRRRPLRVRWLDHRARLCLAAGIRRWMADQLIGERSEQAAAWLVGLSHGIRGRLAGWGIVPQVPHAPTLGELLNRWMSRPMSACTRRNSQRHARLMLARWPGETPATEITAEAARAWLMDLAERYAPSTVGLAQEMSRAIFAAQPHNPFAGPRVGGPVDPSRKVYVSEADAEALMAATTDAEWRAVVALSRWGGLRIPSEALVLRWGDVDWAQRRLVVRSTKTGARMIPLYPRLEAALLALYTGAPENNSCILRTHRSGFQHAIRRMWKRARMAGWPRAWHNMRASRQTDLEREYGAHVACAWIGNSPAVAARHYLQITPADWSRATTKEKP